MKLATPYVTNNWMRIENLNFMETEQGYKLRTNEIIFRAHNAMIDNKSHNQSFKRVLEELKELNEP